MTARDVMTPRPATVPPHASVAEARDLMVTPEGRGVVGIVSYVDVLAAVQALLEED
jgi:CBS domain-containing protein